MRAKILLLAPLLGFLMIAYLLPFLGVVKLSFTDPILGINNYSSAVTDDLLINVIIRTFRICILVTVLSVIAAYTVTFLWLRGNKMTRFLVEVCILVFVFSMGFYIMPALLGGGKSVMIAELIYLRIFQIPQWGLAAAMSVMLLAFVGGFLVMLIRRNGEEFK